MLANHVESAKPSAMVNDHLADDAFIQAQSVTTALEKTQVSQLGFSILVQADYRRVAEDLSLTSRKLARYEDLLNEIYPLVSLDVRHIIDTARQQVSCM